MDWKEAYLSLLRTLSTITHGKEMYFAQDDGSIYSRIADDYLDSSEVEEEYANELALMM